MTDDEIIVKEDINNKEEFIYFMTTQIMETNIITDFSNSIGDTRAVILTRPNSKTWAIFFNIKDE